MKKILGALSALALFAFLASASAGEVSGMIESIDQAQGTFVLDEGSTFTLGEGVSMEGLSPGDEVSVSYEEENGKRIATGVVPAE